MRTINDVMEHMDRGLSHAFQAGIDRANLAAERTEHYVRQWRIVATQFSYHVSIS